MSRPVLMCCPGRSADQTAYVREVLASALGPSCLALLGVADNPPPDLHRIRASVAHQGDWFSTTDEQLAAMIGVKVPQLVRALERCSQFRLADVTADDAEEDGFVVVWCASVPLLGRRGMERLAEVLPEAARAAVVARGGL